MMDYMGVNGQGYGDYNSGFTSTTSGMGGLGPTKIVKIRNLYLIGIPYGYSPMLQRSYGVNTLSAQHLDVMRNTFIEEKSHFGKVSPETIAHSLGGIVGLKGLGAHNKFIEMPNGWSSRRFRVILTIDVTSGVVTKKLLIQGYTDVYGLANSFSSALSTREQLNRIDPNMNIFINSITEIDIIYSARTGTYHYNMGNSYNTLQDYVSKYSQNLDNDLALIRPSDIMRISSVRAYQGHDDIAPGYSNSHGFGEYNSYTCNTSLRKNLDPSNYFSRLINGYISGQSAGSISYDGSELENTFISAANNTPEPTLMNNEFINRLRSITGTHTPTVLTIGHLIQLDPDLTTGNAFGVFENNDMGEVISLNPELGSQTTSTTIEPTPRNIQVLELNNAITGNLVGVGLSQLTFSIDTFSSTPIITVMQGKSLLGDEFVSSCCERFKEMCMNIILPHFTRNGLYKYQLLIHADILKDTTIAITEEGDYLGPKEIFRFPTFADSLYSPMIALKDERNVLIKDFEVIQENVL